MNRWDWIDDYKKDYKSLGYTMCPICGWFNDKRTGDIHVHGDRIQVPAFEIVANPTIRFGGR